MDEEKNRFAMDVQMISEMQSDMQKVIEDLEKQLNLPPYTEGEELKQHTEGEETKQRGAPSVDERRFSM